MPYKPQEVARILGLKPPTLRLWVHNFAPWLSDDAQPRDKNDYTPRQYSQHDLDLLLRVKALRENEGLTVESIKASLPAPDAWKSAAPSKETKENVHSAIVPINAMDAALSGQLARALEIAIQKVAEAKDETIAELRADNERLRRQAEEVERLKADLVAARARADALEMSQRIAQRAQQAAPDEEAPPIEEAPQRPPWYARFIPRRWRKNG